MEGQKKYPSAQIWSLTRSPKTREAPALLLRAFEASVPAFLTRARAAAALAARCCACCFTCLEYFLCRWFFAKPTIWHIICGDFSDHDVKNINIRWKFSESLWMWDAPPIIKGYQRCYQQQFKSGDVTSNQALSKRGCQLNRDITYSTPDGNKYVCIYITYIISCCIISYYVILSYIILDYIVLYYMTLYYIIPYYTIS